MEIKISGNNYEFSYDSGSSIIKCTGSFRFNNKDESYTQIVELLNDIAEKATNEVTLDLSQMRFLNSLGIGTISKFVIRLRNQKDTDLKVLASRKLAWQDKFIKNLSRLMPTMQTTLL